MTAVLWTASARGEQITIDAAFPGGNILVERIEGDVVEVKHPR
jgi:hypothetical protein